MAVNRGSVEGVFRVSDPGEQNELEGADDEVEASVFDPGKIVLVRHEEGDKLLFDLQGDRDFSNAFITGAASNPVLTAARLFEISRATSRITIYPISTSASGRFFQPKYRRIRSIEVECSPLAPEPGDADDALGFLRDYLPTGFIKDPMFGLGLIKEGRPIIDAIEEIDGISRLHISGSGDTHIDGDTFFLQFDDYEELRLAFQRIARRYQGESFKDRSILAHNEILTKLNPVKFPPKDRPYEPGTVFKLLGARAVGKAPLRGKDRVAVVRAVSANVKAIAEKEPLEFVQLQKDIELVTLDQLIAAYAKALARNRAEPEWQKLFELNPFILSMVFGYPVVLVTASASVGGLTLSGNGTKIADFLMKNSSTYNAALVEIKKPAAPLLGEEYRTGVWSPSKELMGAVVQVLDQRRKFVSNIAPLKEASRTYDLEASAVDCVVVAGRTPDEPAKLASLELIRSQFKDVRLVTFDELYEKLILLRELLSGERYVPSSITDEDEE